jgi:hypothetical protein
MTSAEISIADAEISISNGNFYSPDGFSSIFLL